MKKTVKEKGPSFEADIISMVTRMLPVLNSGTDLGFFDYVDQKNINYTYAFHQIYNRTEEIEDKSFQEEICTKYSMSLSEYRSCVSESKALRTAEDALDEKRKQKIDELKIEYADEETDAQQRFKINNKIASLVRQNNQNAVFGGRAILRKLTKQYNRIKEADVNIPRLIKEIKEMENRLDTDKEISKRDYRRTKYKINVKKQEINRLKDQKNKAIDAIPKLKEELEEGRILDASVIGEANQKGNRFADFDLINGYITLKITGGQKYRIHVKIPRGFEEELRTVQELIDKKEIAVSIHINKDYIKLHYDIAVVNGYSFDRKTARKETNEIKACGYPKDIQDEKINEAYKKQYAIQKQKMLAGKIEGRCMSIDQNPGEIGYCVLQKDDTQPEGYVIISAGRLSWQCLMRRIRKKSSSSKYKRLNNKRKTAVSLAFKLLFEVAVHYKCSEFIVENLDFSDEINNKSKESNRKCNNLWYRTLSSNIINRRCVKNGIRLVKTNACYTSFIGNIKHDFCDSTNASIEIGRRGLLRYKSESFYPQMTMRDRDTMMDVAMDGDRGDAHDFTYGSWKEAHKSCQNCFSKKADFEYRYRAALDDSAHPFTRVKREYYKSGIQFIVFRNL